MIVIEYILGSIKQTLWRRQSIGLLIMMIGIWLAPVCLFGQRLTLDNTPSFEIRSEKGASTGYITADTIIPLSTNLYGVGFRNPLLSITDSGSRSAATQPRQNTLTAIHWTLADVHHYLGPPQYHELRSVMGEVILARRFGFWFLLDQTGTRILPDSFQQIAVNGPWVTFINRDTTSGRLPIKKRSLVNVHKRKIVLDSLGKTQPETEGIRLFKTQSGWGGLSLWGDTVVPFRYHNLQTFVGGRAVAQLSQEGKMGVIDRENHWVVSPIYKDIQINCYGLIAAMTDTTATLSDAKGNIIDGGICDSIWLREDQWFGYRTSNGEQYWFSPTGCRLPTEGLDLLLGQDTIGLFRHGVVWQYRGSEGQILSYGIDLLTPTFTSIGPLAEGLAPSQQFGRMGFIGPEGLKRIGHRYDSVLAFADGRAAVKLNLSEQINGWGFIDRKDSLICQPVYDAILPYCDSIAVVTKGAKYQILDHWGKPLLPQMADSVSPAMLGGYTFRIGGKWGYIDSKGNTRLLPKYLQLELFTSNLVTYQGLSGKFGLYSAQEGVGLEPIFRHIKYNPYSGGTIVWQDKRGY